MPGSDRYTRTAILLHWLVAALVVATFAWGWWMQAIPKQPPGVRADAFNLHKSIGLTILLLMLVRLGWRLAFPPPDLPPMPRWQARLAHANHRLMYAAIFVLAIGGYLGSAWSGYPVKFFGWAIPAWSGEQKALKELASAVHLAASWVLALSVSLHAAGTLKHAIVDRNGVLERMLPARRRHVQPAPAQPAPSSASSSSPPRAA